MKIIDNEKIEYRKIPGYPGYCISNCDIVISPYGKILSQYLWGGYLYVDAFSGSELRSLKVSRAVAFAWVHNPNPEKLIVVNHIDGRKFNNHASNLEWCDYSGNNYHAVNSNLRSDAIPCEIRNFYTKEILAFNSIAQAAEYMGLKKDTPFCMLKRKKFGALIKDRYEFRYKADNEPWFYEERTKIVPRSRYMILAKLQDESIEEIYSSSSFLKKYQLYGAPSRSIPALVEYANKTRPGIRFAYRDSYFEEQFRVPRQTNASKITEVVATLPDYDRVVFNSITKCAKHFGVDRSVILRRLDRHREFKGWYFTSSSLQPGRIVKSD